MVGHCPTCPCNFLTVCHLDVSHANFLVGALAPRHLHYSRHRGHVVTTVSESIHSGISIISSRDRLGVARLDLGIRRWDSQPLLPFLCIRTGGSCLPVGLRETVGTAVASVILLWAESGVVHLGVVASVEGFLFHHHWPELGIDLAELEPRQLFMRSVYLLVMGWLLGYLAEQQKQLRAEVERARVARELHDGALQSMISVAMQLEVVRRQSALQSVSVSNELERIHDVLLEEARKLRDFMQQMRQVEVNAKNLRAHLGELIERFQRETGITAEFVCESNVTGLRAQVCDAVARIVQEGLVNVRKHSGASHVHIQFHRSDAGWRLIIDDDGRGFPFSGCLTLRDLEAEGKGPVVIRECVRSIGGELRLESISRRGSRLEITIPQKRPAVLWILKGVT